MMSAARQQDEASASLRARILAVVESQLRDHPWLVDPEAAAGRCIDMSRDLVDRLEKAGISARPLSLMGNLVPQHRRARRWDGDKPLCANFYHVVVEAGGYYIDPTYRQMDRDAPLPHIGMVEEIEREWLWSGATVDELLKAGVPSLPPQAPDGPAVRPTSTDWVWADEQAARLALAFAVEHNEHLDNGLLADVLERIGRRITQCIDEQDALFPEDAVQCTVMLEFRIEWPRREGDPCRLHLAPVPMELVDSALSCDVPLERRRAAARTWREWPELLERYGAWEGLPPPGRAGVEMLRAGTAAAGPDEEEPEGDELLLADADEGPSP